MKRPSILVISYVPNYNRQGYDIAECLRKERCSVRLCQMNGVSDRTKGIVGVRCVKPHGPLHKFHMLRNLLVFFIATVFLRKDIVICVGRPMLMLGGFYQICFRSKLIWYSLEYSKLGFIDRFVYKNCVSGYIDVEENRRDAIFKEYGRKNNSIVCYNMPHLHEQAFKGGKLRSYLNTHYNFSGAEKLVVYAGSYQTYACLEEIINASKMFSADVKLILMSYGLPERLKKFSVNCICIDPVHGEEFYEWLSDADCALLPYESDDDFNVQNCSPQKIFDCYMVGVPYVASDRPIIRSVLEKCPSAGVICDFRNPDKIAEVINGYWEKNTVSRAYMIELHKKWFNYNTLAADIDGLINAI